MREAGATERARGPFAVAGCGRVGQWQPQPPPQQPPDAPIGEPTAPVFTPTRESRRLTRALSHAGQATVTVAVATYFSNSFPQAAQAYS
jgi:hypothetical protein